MRFIARILLLLLVATGLSSAARAQRDKIEGIWWNNEKSAKIEIYRAAVDKKFYGKIVWLKEPNKDGKPKVDDKNPNAKKRNTPLMGYPVLKGFEVDDEDTYDSGTIYDPKNGKTYDCKITYRNKNELGIRGYVGVSLLGRTTTWTRAE